MSPSSSTHHPELERRSNELLDAALAIDAYDELSAEEIARIGGQLTPLGLAEVGGAAAAEKLRLIEAARDAAYESLISRRLLCGKIVAALDDGDRRAAVRLAGDDQNLLRFIALYRRKRGEQKRRPRDHSPLQRELFNKLWNEINLLRRLWKQNEIRVTDPKQAAIKIILERHRWPHEAEFINYDKNRRR